MLNKIIDQIIVKEPSNLNEKDRKFLLLLSKHPKLQKHTEVIYTYKLLDEHINYPNKDGNTLYIGEACRKKSPTGERFKHISGNTINGNDYVSNYTLTQYYEKGKKLRIEIYELSSDFDRKQFENNLISEHMKIFGSKPIAQGSTGENNTPKYINAKREEELRSFFEETIDI